MKQTKFRITIFALALAFVLSVAAFFALNFKTANAASDMQVDGTHVFTATGANVIVDRQEEDGSKDYTLFTFGDEEDNIAYKKNLAYSWWYKEKAEEGDTEEKQPQNGLFNMEIGFKNTAFKKFIITFESQQHYKTEDNKTVNYIIFFPTADGGVRVAITDDKTIEQSDSGLILSPNHIYIKFVNRENGTYGVTVSDDENGQIDGERTYYGLMENVGGTYAKYSSSTTTPVYPLIFNAEFSDETDADSPVAQMVLYRLNGQEFKVKNARQEGDHYTGGSVSDDTPAVLCMNEGISNLDVGGKVSFSYQLIDVIRSSPSSTLYYYALQYSDISHSDINYNDPENKIFETVETDTLLESDEKTYEPSIPADGGSGFGENFKADMAVKAYAKVVDSSSSGETSYVFLDWYIRDEHKLNIGGYDFIAVGEDVDGVTYNYDGTDGSWADSQSVIAQYQSKVNAAAKNLSAGSSSYFYVPSAEELFADNDTAYRDLKISVYYYGDSQSNTQSSNANSLSINVTKPGSYRFTLYATDKAGNKMYYFDGDKKVEFGTGDIWKMYDDERRDYLPWFTFNVDYKGAQFTKKPDKQSTAYVGTNYTSASFEINGVADSYETKYRLFLFDRAAYYADTQTPFTYADMPYDEFIGKMDELFEGDETRKYFKEIKEVTETDENYEEFKDYNWSSSSTSFTPQDGNAFYYMRAEVTDTEYNTDPVTCSLVVIASVEAKALKGDSDWLQNNVASVILLSVAGVSLIAIILLLVIKPKNKEDIDVQYEKELGKKKKK